MILPLRLARVIGVVFLALMLGIGHVPATIAQGPVSVSDLASRLSPAVVNIGTSRQVRGNGVPFPNVPEGSPLNDLFDELNPNRDMGEGAMREARSLGSGFFISADGLVATNNHVIEGATEILVFTPDGARYAAELVGRDEKTDLAVLKIEAGEPLPFVEFGDSDLADVGDWVMAIGNPFGLGGSVSLGIVSARNRDINSGPYDDFIQTDAAINQGNSGGPLFDMDGNVVGVATAIIARGGSSLGIGFAVPINLAGPIINQLAEFGETRRGWLGVGIQEITSDIATSMGQSETFGAMVVEVTPGGPSEGTLQEGDLILRFDGTQIRDMRDLPRTVAQTPVGRAVDVDIVRDGTEMTVEISLGRLETGELLIAEGREQDGGPDLGPSVEDDGLRLSDIAEALIGFSVAPLTEVARNELGIVSGVRGLLIETVSQSSDAADKGLLPGLIVSEINQVAVDSVAMMEKLVADAQASGREAILLKVVDPSGISRFVAVRMG